MAQSFIKLPVPNTIRTVSADSESVSLRWSVPQSHGLSTAPSGKLVFEFKSVTGNLIDCCDFNPSHSTFKARLSGLSPDTDYKFKIRSKLTISDSQIVHSEWSERFQFRTESKMETFWIISDSKELELASLKQKLARYQMENKKLSLRVQQLEEQLNGPDNADPAHWSWDIAHIVRWLTRIEGGALKQYKEKLMANMQEEGITGKDLVYVEESNLKSWGITGFKDRKLAIHYIQELTANDKKQEMKYHPSVARLLPDTSPLAMEDTQESTISTGLGSVDEEQTTDDIQKPDEVPDEAPEEAPEVNEEPEVNVDQNEEQNEEQNLDKKETVDTATSSVATEDTADTEDVEEKEEQDGGSGIVSASVRELLSHKSNSVKTWNYKDGMLSVTVVRGINLDNMDSDEGPDGGSDPYVELELKGNYRKERTKMIDNEHNPVWNEKFQLFVDNAKEDVLYARVYDHDRWSLDDKIGEVNIPIITILGANGTLRKEFPIIGSKQGATLELDLKYWESKYH